MRSLFQKIDDLSTPENRARERQRRIALSAGMSMVAKVISVATALISVPLTLHYLGSERYGMWLVLSSLIAMLSFADFGVGNGVLNTIAAAHGRGDVRAVRTGLSSGLAVLVLIAGGILGILALSYPHLAWSRLFNVRSPLALLEAGPAVATFTLCFAIAMPMNVVQRVEMGLQRSFLASIWQAVGSVLALVAVWTAISAHAGLPWLVAAYMGGPLLANLCNSLLFFGVQEPDIAPSLSFVDMGDSMQILSAGILFLILQASAAAMFSSDNIIIAQILGASSVPQYAVPERLFGLITVVLSMGLGPLWPAYRASLARGDVAWVRSTLYSSLKYSALFSALSAGALFLLAPRLLQAWVGSSVTASTILLGSLAIWKVIESVGLCYAMFLNGAHLLRAQAVMAIVTSVVSVTLEIYFVKRIGVAGAVLATLLAYTILTLVPCVVTVPRVLRKKI